MVAAQQPNSNASPPIQPAKEKARGRARIPIPRSMLVTFVNVCEALDFDREGESEASEKGDSEVIDAGRSGSLARGGPCADDGEPWLLSNGVVSIKNQDLGSREVDVVVGRSDELALRSTESVYRKPKSEITNITTCFITD